MMIICFYKRQIQLLLEQKWFQCDMAFKRLKNENEKEIVFAMLNRQNQRSKLIIYLEYIMNALCNILLMHYSIYSSQSYCQPRIHGDVLPDVYQGIYPCSAEVEDLYYVGTSAWTRFCCTGNGYGHQAVARFVIH